MEGGSSYVAACWEWDRVRRTIRVADYYLRGLQVQPTPDLRGLQVQPAPDGIEAQTWLGRG